MYGSYEISGEDVLISKSIDIGISGTNNEAEYLTMIAGIEELINKLKTQNIDLQSCLVEIYSDSRLVVNEVQGHFKVNLPHLRKLRDRSLELLSNFKIWAIRWNSREVNVQKFNH